MNSFKNLKPREKFLILIMLSLLFLIFIYITSSNAFLKISSSKNKLESAKSDYEHVLKRLKEFKPEFVLFSAGFDAHMDDPLAQFKLKSKDFYDITKRTLKVVNSSSNSKVVSVLEGGYDLNALKESADMHLNALTEN